MAWLSSKQMLRIHHLNISFLYFTKGLFCFKPRISKKDTTSKTAANRFRLYHCQGVYYMIQGTNGKHKNKQQNCIDTSPQERSVHLEVVHTCRKRNEKYCHKYEIENSISKELEAVHLKHHLLSDLHFTCKISYWTCSRIRDNLQNNIEVTARSSEWTMHQQT